MPVCRLLARSNSWGSATRALLIAARVAARERGMPRVARSAPSRCPGSGKTWVRPAGWPSSTCKGGPWCATSLPASLIAALTVICWPSMARTASSKPSQPPGTRSPGRAPINLAISGSQASCSSMASGSAPRSNTRRKRAMIAGQAASRGKWIVAAKALPCALRTRTAPCSPSKAMVRQYSPSITASTPVMARAARNASIADQS
ncbi:hypothetical protein D3C81_1549650 [compost metagenome]